MKDFIKIWFPPINLWSFPKKENKLSVRIDPLSATIRYYKPPVKDKPLHKMTEQYYKTFVVQFLDDGEIRITATMVAPTVEEIRILAEKLSKNYLKATWRHKNREYFIDLTQPPFVIQRVPLK